MFMSTHPLISIITPVYNHENFIGKCIDSVIAQTVTSWELIIIDDGSTDRTGSIVESYADSRIRYVRQENRGIEFLADTYNRALALARGDLIAILEGDDWWPPDKLSWQVRDFDDAEIVLSYGYTQEVDEKGAPIRLIPERPLPNEALHNIPVGMASRYLMDMNVLTYLFPVSVVIRKDTLVSIGGFQQLPHLPLVDYPTFMQLARQGRFSFHGEILGYWRRHPESITRRKYYRINEGVYCYLLQFQREHAAALPIRMEELALINRQWQEFKWHQWFTLGRWFLVDGEWAQARRAFARCRPYTFNWKHPMLLSFCRLLSWVHHDIEFVISLLSLKNLDDAIEDFNRDNITLSKSMVNEL